MLKFLVLLLLAFPALAEQCPVVGVSDGDTIKVRCGEQISVRLAEIDAPEKRQPFGQRSKQALSDMCFGKIATITPQTKDRYGRLVARVECAGKDANVEMVRQGMAWRYTAYSKDPAIGELERQARSARVWLWSDPEAVAPWEWRRKARAVRDQYGDARLPPIRARERCSSPSHFNRMDW